MAAGGVVSGAGPRAAPGRRAGPPPAGAAGFLVIVTVFVAMAVWPSSSFARTVTMWLPGASKRRESLRRLPVWTAVPSTA